MDALNIANLKELMQMTDDTSISIYLPTFKKGAETEQNSIRFRNIIRETEKQLKGKGHRKSSIDKILTPAKQLINDSDFWNHQSEGFAVFMSPNVFKYFRVPIEFSEEMYINSRFYIKPILPAINRNEKFFVLSLDRKQIRLFEGTRYGINEVELDNIPTSLEEEVEDFEFHQLTFRTNQRGANKPQLYNGPGFGTDDARWIKDLHRFYQRIDKGIINKLGEGYPPLVLSGVEYLIPHFREVSSYSKILDKAVELNTDEMSDRELFEHSWKVAGEHFDKSKNDSIFLYEQLYDTERTSNNIVDIIPAVFSNKIQTLFVNPQNCLWGKFDQDSYRLEIHESKQQGDEDLCDLAIMQAILHNAEVFTLNKDVFPEADPLAAIFRY